MHTGHGGTGRTCRATMMGEGDTVVEITERFLASHPLPGHAEDTDKDSRGRVLVVGGGASSPGAVILSGLAALRGGAGKLQLAVPCQFSVHIGISFVEAGVRGFAQTAEGEPAASAAAELCASARQVDAIVVGPGLKDGRAASQLAAGLLEGAPEPACIIDAMALERIAESKDLLARRQGRVILTPHAGEMAQICGASKDEIRANPIRYATQTARELRCFVVLKGADTFIASPEGVVLAHRGGVIGLATSGSGDVLAGLIGAFSARGAQPLYACAWGVFVHARAGARLSERLGSVGLLARELTDEIPLVVKGLESVEKPAQGGAAAAP